MLERIDRKAATRIVEKVEQLAIDPAPLANNITRLKGESNLLRLRIGDWRVIYEDGVVLLVERIAPRGSAYNWGVPMTYEPQKFRAPDGTEMVVLRAADYERLVDLADEGEDVIEALKTRARIEAGEGTAPGDVVRAIIVDGLHPIAAWRRYRGLSQAALARRSGLSQVWISRIERGGGHGSRDTRHKLAAALDAPIWALEEDFGD